MSSDKLFIPTDVATSSSVSADHGNVMTREMTCRRVSVEAGDKERVRRVKDDNVVEDAAVDNVDIILVSLRWRL